MSSSAIEWTDDVWNPSTGCDRVGPGCAHCYAAAFAPRLRKMAQARGTGKWLHVRDGGKASGPAFGLTLHPETLDFPLKLTGQGKAAAKAGVPGKLVFVNSMSDLWHDEVPVMFIAEVFAAIAAAPQHHFQILTKRAERMRSIVPLDAFEANVRSIAHRKHGVTDLTWPLPNMWLGVSIENRRFVHRADLLRETPTAVRFVSAEPLLGPLVHDDDTDGASGHPAELGTCWSDLYRGPELDLSDIDWLIVGGESGPAHRPVHESWVRGLHHRCFQMGMYDCPRPAFFFKQWGGPTPKAGGRELNGRTWDEFPRAALAAGPAGAALLEAGVA